MVEGPVQLKIQAYEKLESINKKIKADTTLAQQQQQLIASQSDNMIIAAKADGEAFGVKELKDVLTFLDGLNTSVTDVNDRVNIFEMREKLAGRSQDIANLNSGKLKMIYAPKTMDVRLDMPGASKDPDRRLQRLGEASLPVIHAS